MTTTEMLNEIMKEQVDVEFWGRAYTFKPRLIEKVWGDGKQLVQIFPLMERPRYWLVRVDGSCIDDDRLLEILNQIDDAINEQFGSPDDEDIGFSDDRPYYPMADSDGYAWHFCRREGPTEGIA